MTTNANTRQVLAVLASAVVLSACGGGGSDATTSVQTSISVGKAEGIYAGTLTGSTNNSFRLIVLENDEFWGISGIISGNTFNAYGLTHGQGVSNAGSFTSPNAISYSGTGSPITSTVQATYIPATNVNGVIAASSGSVSFNSTPITGSLYNYNSAATLSTISGAWNTTALSGTTIALSINADGSFSGLSSDNCTLTGNVVPRPSGKNVFNVSLTFGPAPCALPGKTGSGIALAYPLSTSSNQLIVALTDSTLAHGSVIFGIR